MADLRVHSGLGRGGKRATLDRRCHPGRSSASLVVGSRRCANHSVPAWFSRYGAWLAQDGSLVGGRGLARRRAVPAGLCAVVDVGGRQLSRRGSDGRCTTRSRGGGSDGPRRPRRTRLGGARGRRPRGDAPEPLHQGRAHVGAARGHVSRGSSEQGPPHRPVAASAGAELVCDVLPIALAPRAFRIVGGAAAVAPVVTRIRRTR